MLRLFIGLLSACCLLSACDLVPASGGLRAFPTATALSKNGAVGEPGADNARDSSLVTPAAWRTVGRSTIPPLLTSTPTPSGFAALITPGTPLPTGTPTITLTPFATPTRYRTPTDVPAPPTVTPLEGAPAGGGGSEASPTPLRSPVPAEPRATTRPGLTPPPLPPIAVDVGQPATSQAHNGIVFIVIRVDKGPKRIDVIYRITNQTGSAISFTLTNTDQRLVRGGTVKGPADPGGAANITLQSGQNYDSGTTFFINAANPNGDDLIFAIDNLPRIGTVQVRIP